MAALIVILLSANEKADSKGAICLLDSTDIRVKSNLTAVVDIHKSFQITSASGLGFAQVIIPINDFMEVRDISGYTVLPDGRKVKLIKQDIGTSSAPGFQGFGDIQVMTFSLRTPVVGSKLFYKYKLFIKSLLYLPRIAPRTDCPTNRLAVSVKWDKKVSLRFDTEGVEERRQERSAYFTANDLPEIPEEPFSCPSKLYVFMSSDNFTYGKAHFRSRSWSEAGGFFARLSAQPDDSNPTDPSDAELRELVSRLCRGSLTREDTLKALFNFMADSVSYVALQMGKGGFAPHNWGVILNRRFGDCKDQSVLFSTLCSAAGYEAYPALIFTGDFPKVDKLHPWPSWFDHVVTVVRNGAEELLLDPSDPLASVGASAPRLRGKCYLVCDGKSGLKKLAAGPDPAMGIFWHFYLNNPSRNGLAVDFTVRYINDAAGIYQNLLQIEKPAQAEASMQSQLRHSGWNLASFELNDIRNWGDSLIVTGNFLINMADAGESRNLAIASPLSSYLLENLFPDVRKTDYCRSSKILLEETIIVDDHFSGLMVGPEYSDSWRREGFSFEDQMVVDDGKAIYRRLYKGSEGTLRAVDYNAFRDFLLSRKDQQYVRLQK